LVAVAHGSVDPRAAATVSELLSVVRDRAGRWGLPGIDVRTAYLGHAPPTPRQVLGALAAERDGGSAKHAELHAVVLPLLLTPAYHSKTDLPAVLSDAQTAFPRLRLGYGSTLGPHPGLLRAAERRLTEAAGPLNPRSTAIVLAAAGSSDPAANATVNAVAARWQAARGWQAVVPAYASAASPTPGQAVAALKASGARNVVVATYLLAPGFFADQVRRQALAAGATAVSGALGAAPEIADVVLERYAEAIADTRQRAAV
jgi:sirohydrochlorin ferrochelatase